MVFIKITRFFLVFFGLLLVPGPLFAQNQVGKYGGVGILLDFDPQNPQRVLIYSVTYKSPADKAKIRRGDRLLKVDGLDVTGQDLKALAEKIRGPLGSTVVLTIEGGAGVSDFPLVRSEIPTGPMVSVPPPGGGVAPSGVFFTSEERELLKKKIMGLTSDEQREKMKNLLDALKNQKITKAQFFKFIKSDF